MSLESELGLAGPIFFASFAPSAVHSSSLCASVVDSLPNPWVRQRIEEIRHKVHHHISQADHQDAALYQVIIAATDCLDGQATDSRPGKNCLGHNRTSQ